MKLIIPLTLLLLLTITAQAQYSATTFCPTTGPNYTAFGLPPAEGFGASATGGCQAGRVHLVVDTLALTVDTTANTAAGVLASPGPDGKISLLEALRGAGGSGTMGPRFITFSVSGSINFAGLDYEIENGAPGNYDDFTIDGGDAPNYGIQIINGAFSVRVDNVILRYFKVKSGATASTSIDSLRLDNATNVMVDHCSIGAGDDGDLDIISSSSDITVQWCLLGPGFGSGNMLINNDANRLSVHHNQFIKSDGGSARWPGLATGVEVSWTNNAFYIDDVPEVGGHMEAQSGWSPTFAAIKPNIEGNYFKQGPSVTAYDGPNHAVIYLYGDAAFSGTASFYIANNAVANPAGIVTTTQTQIYTFSNGNMTIAGSPFSYPAITTTTAAQAQTDVLAGAGARLPCGLDAWDTTVVNAITNSSAISWTSQASLGGYPDLTQPCQGGGPAGGNTGRAGATRSSGTRSTMPATRTIVTRSAVP